MIQQVRKSKTQASPVNVALHQRPLALWITMALATAGSVQTAYAGTPPPLSSAWAAQRINTLANSPVNVPSSGVPGSASNVSASSQAQSQLQQSVNNLGQVAQSLSLAMTAQRADAAQQALLATTVPNGLASGGLQAAAGATPGSKLWQNASAPTQSVSNGQTVVDIQQTADKAILNWQTFNVGKNTTVQFDQQSDWVVLNRVVDPNASPSSILGQIKGAGTVLLLNHNGVIFTGTSQVNVRNLAVAAADMTDAQFQANGIYGADESTASFTGAQGNLTVDAGAQIVTNTPGSVTQGGGYILLMGQQVSNYGDIEAQQGQVELAAGDNFVIRQGVGTDANQSSTTRGNEISPQLDVGSTAGQVINESTGLLLARQGDITLAGHDVQQNGVAIATTTVNTRGTIHLLNSANDTTGMVTLGAGAVTAVVIEEDDPTTALDSQRAALIAASATNDQLRLTAASGLFDNLSTMTDLADESRIEIVSGGDVRFESNSLSLATGGQIAVSAAQRTLVADGAVLDVSGQVGVNLAASSNDVLVNIQGNELRDSPDNRDSGNLLNGNVLVDLRDLVPASDGRWYTANGLLEVSGYLSNQGHTIGEWAAQGGTIQLSGSEVVTEQGSQINLAGGSLNVAAGYVAQAWLMGSDGRLYNINTPAPTGITYEGIYQGFEEDHPRWGAVATQYFFNPLVGPQQAYEGGYTVGRDAGQLIVNAPTAVLEGDIDTQVYTGSQQTQARAALGDNYLQAQNAVAKPGTLSFGQYGVGGLNGANDTAIVIGDVTGITSGMADDDVLPADRIGTTWLDAARLNAEGLGELDLASSATVNVDEPLTFANGGILNIIAPTVNIAADVTAHGGSITLTNILASSRTGTNALAPASGLAQLTLEPGVTMDTTGLWVNALTDAADLSGLAYLNGGNVSFDSSEGVTLAAGSAIKVSSGGAILVSGKTRGGTGGDVTLITDDPLDPSNIGTAPLIVSGSIDAAGVNGGGTLTIQTGQTMVVGGDASLEAGTIAANTPAATSLTLAQNLTIPVGGILPISIIQTLTTAPPDTPLPGGITLQLPPGATVTTDADWLLPAFVFTADGQEFRAGSILPAGSTIRVFFGDSVLPAGYVIPSSVFPNGLPIAPFQLTVVAGSVATQPFTYAAGTAIPAGTVFGQDVAIVPVFNDKLFQSGFSNYKINATGGVLVTGGTQIDVVEPVYQFTDASYTTPTGGDPSAALDLWLPPAYLEDPAHATLTRRGGASLELTSVSLDAGGGSIVMQPGSAINVDAGQSVTLEGAGQITIDGKITAPGGAIAIRSNGGNTDAAGTLLNHSIWIGSDATLDAAAQAVTALDEDGRPYGVVPGGGSIQLGGTGVFDAKAGALQSTPNFVIIRPGAVLDASGASATIDPNAGDRAASSAAGAPFTLASDGGSIALDSLTGIYNDGTLRAAAGGAGASGGSLSISLENGQRSPVVLTVTQGAQPTGLADDLAPDTSDPALVYGQASVSADAIAAGGFDNVSLYARDIIQFVGDVRLTAGQSIKFYEGAFSDTVPTGQVQIDAPYVLFGGHTSVINSSGFSDGSLTSQWSPSRTAQQPGSTFEVNADLIDFENDTYFSASGTVGLVNYDFTGFQNVDFISQGDIRFVAGAPDDANAGAAPPTRLLTPGNISFTAAQLYPTTGTVATVMAGASNCGNYCVPTDSTSSITVNRISSIDPGTPDSVFGTLSLYANYIDQGGIVRAPLGVINLGDSGGFLAAAQQIELLPGSITSISAAGLTIPYGGTTDGVSYDYAGAALAFLAAGNHGLTAAGINISAASVDVQNGATLDLSGGGNLTGHGFIQGRGGSVDVLTTPLINADPGNTYSAASDKVYAIVPGYGSAYAPVSAETGDGAPGIGQQITVPAGVPGLPAGTYTLLPSTYALLPGAFRVELGGTQTIATAGAVAVGNGSYSLSGTLSIANTDVKSPQLSTLLVTPGTAVRNLSQYDEEGYSDFLTANAAQFGNLLPILPADGKALAFTFLPPSPPTAGDPAADNLPAFSFDGTALFQGAEGGKGGTAILQTSQNGARNIEVYANATGPTAGFDGVSLSAADVDAIGAPELQIGGASGVNNGTNTISIGSTLNGNLYVRSGVTLRAAELILGANGDIDIDPGAVLTTIGMGAAPSGQMDGYVYSAPSTALVLSNSDLEFTGASGTGAITIGAGAQLYSEGSLIFATNGAVSIDPDASYGSRSLQLAAANINIGDASAMAGAVVPTGISIDQSLFNRLVAGAGAPAVPALEELVLSASDAVNFYGTTGLDATGGDLQLVLTTPAIYGYGAAGDHATLSAGTLTWNGTSGAPGAVVANGPGTGLGTLDINVGTLVLGTPVTTGLLDTSAHDRATYGFSNVDITATDEVISNSQGSLSVYQAPGTTAGDVLGQSGTGGNLTIVTPLLTGSAGSVMAYNAGGALNISAPAGVVPSTAASAVSGAEIDLTGGSVAISTAIVLPSGKLVINASGDVLIADGARLDVSGQPVTVQGQTAYGFGGDISLSSDQGNITQQAGSTINVSATGNDAGSLTITATGASGGQVSLGGTLLGASTPVAGDATIHADGSFSVAAQTLAGGSTASLNDDFSTLNQTLTDGGFFASRAFDLRQGDLTIGDGVKAHSVTVSLDGGSLAVNGTIDASGAAPGSIRLSAKNDLTLAASGVLDAHGTVLQVDSYGQPIDASNKATIELASTGGTLTLAAGSTMNTSSPDGVARGEIDLNAARTGETSGDIKIAAAGTLDITGAQSIALNGFWTYSPTDAYGSIVQDNGSADPVSATTGYLGMNQVDARSQTFIDAALRNTDLLDRIAGLRAYSDAFHLRPGVEIDSATPNGTLTVAGDIDLAGLRYDSLNPNFQKTGTYGSGEPGALVIRAGGDLDIVGSISDGFMPAPATPDDTGWVLQAGAQTSSIETLLPVVLDSGTIFPNTSGLSLRYAIDIKPSTIRANAVIPAQVTLSDPYTIPAGTRLSAPIYDGSGNVLYGAGTVMASAITLDPGTQLGAGSMLPGSVDIAAMTWPTGASLGIFTSGVTLSANVTVPFEGIIPAGSTVLMASSSAPTRATDSAGTQGSIDAIAAMLPQGELSWSMRLVSGADLGAADTRLVKPLSDLKALGGSGNLTLTDSHVAQTTTQKIFYYYSGKRYYVGSLSDSGCVAYGCTVANIAQITGADPSVVRTGTGDLDLVAGGSFSEQSLYGVYTAGTQSPALGTDGSTSGVTEASNPFNTPRGVGASGTVLDPGFAGKQAAIDATFQSWYPEHGGDVLLSAQGDVTGYIGNGLVASDQTGNWLLRQGDQGQATSWWVNFGTYAPLNSQAPDASFLGFQGIGTLGGGNLTVVAGGNAGITTSNNTSSNGLDLAVASTGRVLADGSIVQTGGGNLTLDVGGALNSYVASDTTQSSSPFGSITDLRGDIAINAGAIGVILGTLNGTNDHADPRGVALQTVETTQLYGGPTITPGDGSVQVSTRGNLVLTGMGDAGMADVLDPDGKPKLNPDGSVAVPGGWGTWFTLWTPSTSVALFSAGGDVAPQSLITTTASSQNNNSGLYPASLSIVAASGNVRFLGSGNVLELMPSPQGQLEVLAGTSIFGSGGVVAMSGADMASLATPDHSIFGSVINLTDGNANPNAPFGEGNASPLAFGPDTPTTDLHTGDSQPALVYANTDIVDLQVGAVQTFSPFADFSPTPSTWYLGAKPFQIIAGRDIVGTGITSGFILNDSPNDISVIQAGRDIIYETMAIGGPGLLNVQAGRNLYQGALGTLDSVGALVDVNASSSSSGASIAATAGVGAAGPDYTGFAELYFNAANQADAAIPDTDPANAGKVPMTYADQLYAWMQQRFGYSGTETNALTAFLALPSEQQGVFVRQVYFEELDAGGQEFNDPASKRYQSYLRGRDAIAALFPDQDAKGQPIVYDGDITMFSANVSFSQLTGQPDPVFNPKDPSRLLDGGIHTDFGGDIQLLSPGGQTIVGVEGITPGAGAGLITQGAGSIDMYSLGSILLGESRIMTTFGGDILAWSATGDINAGRGSKTTQVFTPPRLVYDDIGNITLSPVAPVSGAGIATLAPIPEVPPGNVNLIAPLGTIDAGEAGIRVSGNANLAALHIVNAANIQVQGKATGLPVVAQVNVGALTTASAAASAVNKIANDLNRKQQNDANSNMPSIISVQVLGFGDGGSASIDVPATDDHRGTVAEYDANSAFQVLGNGALNEDQQARLTPAERLRLAQ